jgi:lysine-arginine-ornithine-binding protein
MTRFLRLAAAGLGWFIAMSAGPAFAQNPPLRLGTEGAYAPFNYINKNGQVEGFDVDIGNALCARMHRRCTWVTQEWQGMIPALQGRKFDVIVASMAITPARREQVDFTKPYYRTVGMMVGRHGSGLDQSPAALKGRRIGAVRGTSNARYVRQRYGDIASVREYLSSDDMFLDFLIGRLDVVFGDAVEMRPWIDRNGGETRYARIGDYVHDPLLAQGIGIAVRRGDTKLLAALNSALDQIVQDGTYDQINRKYFSFKLN